MSRHRKLASKARPPKSIKQASKILAAAKLESETRYAPLTDGQRFGKNALAITSALLFGFVAFVVLVSQLIFMANQQQLRNSFREQLAQGVAPTGEVGFDNILLTDGAPVAIMRIPKLHSSFVVVQGTDSGTLTMGPGHRRDTVMPGQFGTSVLMGRASSYGAPFAKLQSLPIGTKIDFITGQGKSTYEVLGVRYQGDYQLPQIGSGEGRLMLLTSRGAPFLPTGVLRLDAKLVSTPLPVGAVVSNIYTMPPQEREMGFDLRFGWALVLSLQLLLGVLVVFVLVRPRISRPQAFLVFVPVILFSSFLVFDQVVKVLPNLL